MGRSSRSGTHRKGLDASRWFARGASDSGTYALVGSTLTRARETGKRLWARALRAGITTVTAIQSWRVGWRGMERIFNAGIRASALTALVALTRPSWNGGCAHLAI